MNVYKVSTGGGNYIEEVITAHNADAKTIVVMAFTKNPPKSVGMLVEISGGHFDEEVYVSGEGIVTDMGRFAR